MKVSKLLFLVTAIFFLQGCVMECRPLVIKAYQAKIVKVDGKKVVECPPEGCSQVYVTGAKVYYVPRLYYPDPCYFPPIFFWRYFDWRHGGCWARPYPEYYHHR